jgi:cytidyltransferase-like protein
MAKIKTLVIASGYFNPLHIGHVEYLQRSKELGDSLIVIINNDLQVGLKGSKVFQNELERKAIIDALKPVDYTLVSIDENRSVKRSIEFIHKFIKADKYIFTNGGDQFGDTILEKELCNRLGIELVDGLGDKIQSSSHLKNKL